MPLKQFIEENFFSKSGNLKSSVDIQKKFPIQCLEILNKTSFLPNDTTFLIRVLYVKAELKTPKKCKTCKKELKINDSRSFYNKKFCSFKCSANNNETKQKTKESNLKKYGVENLMYSDEIKAKRESTILKKYKANSSFLVSIKKSSEKRKQTNLKRYGTENPSQSEEVKYKRKDTFLKRYGVENPAQIKEVKEKIKKTNLERYGAENPMQNANIQEQSKKTNLERYGVKFPLQNEKIKNKQKKQITERYGVENPFQSEEIKEKIKQTNLEKYNVQYYNQKHILHYDEFTCSEKFLNLFEENSFNKLLDYFNITERTLYLRCKSLGIVFDNIISTGHQQYIDYIKSLDENIKIEINDRKTITPLELDIYLPDYNLAIEFNGIYWHTENNGKDRNYHLNKTKLCEEKDIQLLHIFENENEEIWKSVIASKLGFSKRIYARKCKVGIINENEYSMFLKLNHLQGYSLAKYKYGLFYENELVAVMSFSKSRYNKKYDYELIRYCNKIGFSVIGGASKLLSYFKKENKGTIISYANRRWSNGNLYKQLNFKQLKTANPNYFYIIDGNLKSRLEYQKHKLKDKLKIFDDKLTEWENMQLNGYDRIWDCGNLVFVVE